jgi:hypothetical protein
LNRSEINANVTFLGKLSNKETYWKMALSLGLIKSNCLSHRGCTNTFKLLVKLYNKKNAKWHQYLSIPVLVDR